MTHQTHGVIRVSKGILQQKRKPGKNPPKPPAKPSAEPRRISGVVDRHRFVVTWVEVATFIQQARDALSEVHEAVRDRPNHPDLGWLDAEAVLDALVGLDQLGSRMCDTPVKEIEGIISSPVRWATADGRRQRRA